MNRRDFLRLGAAAFVTGATGCAIGQTPNARSLPRVSAHKLPRWHGFNLLEKFNVHKNEPFVESDFAWMA